jgi:hypothetical protein
MMQDDGRSSNGYRVPDPTPRSESVFYPASCIVYPASFPTSGESPASPILILPYGTALLPYCPHDPMALLPQIQIFQPTPTGRRPRRLHSPTRAAPKAPIAIHWDVENPPHAPRGSPR